MDSGGDDEDVIETYRVHVSSKYLELTQQKLQLTRLPHEILLPRGREWEHGVPKSELEPLVDFWLENYDWRAQETLINASLPQYRTKISPLPLQPSLRIHFVHKRSSHPHAIPLLFCHGWPGSILEVSKIIEHLTNPSKGQNVQAFHVVAPSMPGFGFSDASLSEGMGLSATAAVFDALMQRLGYKGYVVHGGGLGSHISRLLANRHPSSCLATHVTSILVQPPSWSHRRLRWFQYLLACLLHRFFPAAHILGYHPTDFSLPRKDNNIDNNDNEDEDTHLIGHPQTLSYALCDSPVGLLAYIRQRLHTSSSTYPWTPTEILNWTMLHWLPGPEAGLRFLRESTPDLKAVREQWGPVPLGITVFSGSWRGPPPMWGACVQPLMWVRRREGCGTYAAWERPEELVADLRDFFGVVVASSERRVMELVGDLAEVD